MTLATHRINLAPCPSPDCCRGYAGSRFGRDHARREKDSCRVCAGKGCVVVAVERRAAP